MKINKKYHIRRKGQGKGKLRRNPPIFTKTPEIKFKCNSCGDIRTNYVWCWKCGSKDITVVDYKKLNIKKKK